MKNAQKKSEVRKRITKTVNEFLGECITEPIQEEFSAKIEYAITRTLNQCALEELIDGYAWAEDYKIRVQSSIYDSSTINISLPQWLVEWLDELDVEEILKAPPEGETLVEEKQRMLMNLAMARLPSNEKN